MKDDDASQPEVDEPVSSSDQTEEQSAVAKAAAEGPLPGISDDDGTSEEPVGRRPHDEAKEIIGFNAAGR